MRYRQLLVGSGADPTVLLLPDADIPSDLLRDPQAYIAPAPLGQTAGLVTTEPALVPRFGAGVSAIAQGDNLLNGGYASLAGQPLTIALPGTGGARVHLRSLIGRTTAGASAIRILDGTLDLMPVGMLALSPVVTAFHWTTPLDAREGNTLTILCGGAGAGNLIYLAVQADR